MRNLQNIKNNLSSIFAVIAIGFFMISVATLFSVSVNINEKNKELIRPYSFNDTITITFEDGTFYQTKAPHQLTTDQSFKIKFNLNNIGMIDNKTLSFLSKDILIRCEIDDKIIYRNTNNHLSSKYDDSNVLYMIDLPNNIKNSLITLYYENDKDYTTSFILKDIMIGNRSNLILHYLFREDGFSIFLIILLSFMFIATNLVSLLIKSKNVSTTKETYFKYIAWSCLILSIYIIASQSISHYIWLSYNLFLHIAKYTMPMILPIPLLHAIILRSHPSAHKYLKMGIILASINIILQHLFTLLGITTLTMTSHYTDSVIIVCISVTCYAFYITPNDEKNQSHLMITTLSPLIIGIIGQLICQYSLGYDSLSFIYRLGVFIFLVLQCYEFIKFFIANRDKKLQAELYQKLATIDNLTGLGNRLALSEKKSLYNAGEHKFYCIVMDIDNLKFINDTYGHKYGDAIICKLAEMLKHAFDPAYEKDLFRIGGDEFVIIYHAPKSNEFVQQLKMLIDDYSNAYIDETVNQFSVSYGYSYFDPNKASTFEQVLHEADQKMYSDKKSKPTAR